MVVWTEMRFASFLYSGFITAIVVNPPERKLAKCTSVQLVKKCVHGENFVVAVYACTSVLCKELRRSQLPT